MVSHLQQKLQYKDFLTELFEIELFFDIKIVFTLNWIVTYNFLNSLK